LPAYVWCVYNPVDLIRKNMFYVWGLLEARQTTYKKVDIAGL
jgi:hypothetical protein